MAESMETYRFRSQGKVLEKSTGIQSPLQSLKSLYFILVGMGNCEAFKLEI